MKTLYVVIIIVFTNKYVFADERLLFPDPPLYFTELAKKYGYRTEHYDVVTEDGYILGLFRIRGRIGRPILLMHGIADSSDTWLLRGNKSLGITLASKDRDVWFGNIRGNKYSRNNINLSPKNASFWDFSFNDHGYYDLPAIIDTILSKTRALKLNAIGHSQGNAIFYVLGSTRPEYNNKINVLIALAPICYLQHVPPPLALLIDVAPEVNAFLKAIGVNEVFGEFSTNGKIINFICNRLIIKYPLCALGTLLPLTGFDVSQFAPPFYDLAIKHFPAATTRKNLYHFAQVARRRSFSMFDYGPSENLKKYNSTMPPDYNLKKVTMPVVLLAGRNDKVAVLADVAMLRVRLPNVQKYAVVQRALMNHLDFVWGKDMNEYLFPYIFKALEENGD